MFQIQPRAHGLRHVNIAWDLIEENESVLEKQYGAVKYVTFESRRREEGKRGKLSQSVSGHSGDDGGAAGAVESAIATLGPILNGETIYIRC